MLTRTDSSLAFFETLRILLAALLIGLLSQIAIPLPFSPVPITLQTFGILLVASRLGASRGVAAVLTYIGLGISGLPLFPAFQFGIAKLLGPAGGYYLGFIFAAYIVGKMSEGRSARTLLGMLLGELVILSLGALHLSTYVGWNGVLFAGVVPFIAPDLVKLLLAFTASGKRTTTAA